MALPTAARQDVCRGPEKMLGWVWESMEHGPLISPLLNRWLSITTGGIYDPMHGLWSNVLIGQELSLWRNCLTNILGTTLEQLRAYASLWRPVRNSFAQSLGNPEALFQEKLWKCGQDYIEEMQKVVILR